MLLKNETLVSKMTTPALSVIIPVYNAGQYLADAIGSVLRQTFSDFELIVINDGSTDNSKEVIATFNDKRIRYLENKKNLGIVYSRNRGIKEATGDFVGMVDADDVVYHDKFEKQISFLTKNPEFGMVGSWVKFIDNKGNRLSGKWKLNAPPQKIPSIMLFNNYFVQSAVLYRKDCLRNYSFTNGFEIGEDYLIWYQILKRFKSWNLPEYLMDYRVHQESITKRKNDLRLEMDKKIFKIQLKDLGIDATGRELDLHLLIKEGTPIEDVKTLLEIESWLKKIVGCNQSNQVYNKRYLAQVVANRWLKVCSKTKIFSLEKARICITSRFLFSSIAGFNPLKRSV